MIQIKIAARVFVVLCCLFVASCVRICVWVLWDVINRVKPLVSLQKCLFAINDDNQLDNLLTCSKCSVLRRPPKHINHFELFGIERKFKMDLKKLAQKYKSMQRILHPDR